VLFQLVHAPVEKAPGRIHKGVGTALQLVVELVAERLEFLDIALDEEALIAIQFVEEIAVDFSGELVVQFHRLIMVHPQLFKDAAHQFGFVALPAAAAENQKAEKRYRKKWGDEFA
jgi:hypothetical protein